MAQLRAFQLISKRRKNAPAIQLMREIDHTWHKLRVVATVELCIEQLQTYMGYSLFGSANEKAQFERQNNSVKDRLISLVLKKKLAEPEDLHVMRELLPQSFQHLETLSGRVQRVTGAPDDTLRNLKIAVARSAQEYLCSKQLRFLERSAAANSLREFIFGLKYRQYKKKLFGFSQEQIKKWDHVDRLEAARVRQERLRRKKRAQRALRSR